MHYLTLLQLIALNPVMYSQTFVFFTSTLEELIAKRKAQIMEWSIYDKERASYLGCFQNANRNEDLNRSSCTHPKMTRQKHKSNLDLIEGKLRNLERSIETLGNKILRQSKRSV